MKKKFWQYLKNNHIWLFIGFNVVILGFFTYWVASTSWEESKSDILLGFGILTIVWIVYLIGSYTKWKDL